MVVRGGVARGSGLLKFAVAAGLTLLPVAAPAAMGAPGAPASEEGSSSAYATLVADLLGKAPSDRVGMFATRDGLTSGRFLDFRADVGACALHDLRLHGVPVLAELKVLGSGPGGAPVVEDHAEGAAWEMACGTLGQLRAYDGPAAVVHGWSQEEAAVRWTLADDVPFETDPPSAPSAVDPAAGAPRIGLRIAASGLNATLLLDHAVQVGARAWVAGSGTLIAHAPNILVPGAANLHREAIERAKAAGLLGAEVTVLRTARGLVADVTALDALDVAVDEPSSGRIRFVIMGSETAGRVVVANLAAGLLEGSGTQVRLFERAERADAGSVAFASVPATEAQAGLADVLDPTDDLAPEYWVAHDADGAQVLLSVPRFRTVAFEVEGFLTEVPPSALAGAIAGVVLVALAGVDLVRAPRRRRQGPRRR